MKILITGIGITGKSSFRKFLFDLLINQDIPAAHYDCDYERDTLPTRFTKNKVYIFEDVHGPTSDAVMPLVFYNRIYYLLPSPLTHLKFWLSRIRIWFRTGKIAWDPDKNTWAGSGQPYDIANTLIILKEFTHNWKNRKKWIKEDLQTIKKTGIKLKIVIPEKNNKIVFNL